MATAAYSRSLYSGLLAAALIVSGCFVEPADDDRHEADGQPLVGTDDPGSPGISLGEQNGRCRFTRSAGCFDGHVLSRQDFTVDGKAFFNADDFVMRFHELLDLRREGQRLEHGTDYEIAELTSLDNTSFVQGFTYDISGVTARSGKVRTSGDFAVPELPEGSYALRVQRSVKFAVKLLAQPQELPSSPTPAATGAEQPAGAADGAAADPTVLTVTKSYCAVLYADADLDVRKGQRLYETFSSFNWRVSDQSCREDGRTGATVLHP